MIPFLSWPKRLLTWLLWRFEKLDRYSDLDDVEFYVIAHPELLSVTGLLRDYYYIKRAREWEERHDQ